MEASAPATTEPSTKSAAASTATATSSAPAAGENQRSRPQDQCCGDCRAQRIRAKSYRHDCLLYGSRNRRCTHLPQRFVSLNRVAMFQEGADEGKSLRGVPRCRQDGTPPTAFPTEIPTGIGQLPSTKTRISRAKACRVVAETTVWILTVHRPLHVLRRCCAVVAFRSAKVALMVAFRAAKVARLLLSERRP